MPIGFPAYAERSERFRGCSRKKLCRAAEDALEELNWRPYREERWYLRANVPNRMHIIFMTWGAKFSVEVEDEWLHVRSEGSFALAWLDFGQHGANIAEFLGRLEDILADEE